MMTTNIQNDEIKESLLIPTTNGVMNGHRTPSTTASRDGNIIDIDTDNGIRNGTHRGVPLSTPDALDTLKNDNEWFSALLALAPLPARYDWSYRSNTIVVFASAIDALGLVVFILGSLKHPNDASIFGIDIDIPYAALMGSVVTNAYQNYFFNIDTIEWLLKIKQSFRNEPKSTIFIFACALLATSVFAYATYDLSDEEAGKRWLETVATFLGIFPMSCYGMKGFVDEVLVKRLNETAFVRAARLYLRENAREITQPYPELNTVIPHERGRAYTTGNLFLKACFMLGLSATLVGYVCNSAKSWRTWKFPIAAANPLGLVMNGPNIGIAACKLAPQVANALSDVIADVYNYGSDRFKRLPTYVYSRREIMWTSVAVVLGLVVFTPSGENSSATSGGFYDDDCPAFSGNSTLIMNSGVEYLAKQGTEYFNILMTFMILAGMVYYRLTAYVQPGSVDEARYKMAAVVDKINNLPAKQIVEIAKRAAEERIRKNPRYPNGTNERDENFLELADSEPASRSGLFSCIRLHNQIRGSLSHPPVAAVYSNERISTIEELKIEEQDDNATNQAMRWFACGRR